MPKERYRYAEVIGAHIQILRSQQGLSIRALAKLAGIHHTQLLKMEKGETNSPIETIGKVAEALDISLHDLLNESASDVQYLRKDRNELKKKLYAAIDDAIDGKKEIDDPQSNADYFPRDYEASAYALAQAV